MWGEVLVLVYNDRTEVIAIQARNGVITRMNSASEQVTIGRAVDRPSFLFDLYCQAVPSPLALRPVAHQSVVVA